MEMLSLMLCLLGLVTSARNMPLWHQCCRAVWHVRGCGFTPNPWLCLCGLCMFFPCLLCFHQRAVVSMHTGNPSIASSALCSLWPCSRSAFLGNSRTGHQRCSKTKMIVALVKCSFKNFACCKLHISFPSTQRVQYSHSNKWQIHLGSTFP